MEYIIIVPLIVFFWFFILAIFLILLSKNTSVEQILLISAAIIAAARITSYFEEDLSKDLAKLFPFTVLVIFLLEPNFFKLGILLERAMEIPSLLNHILIFLIFIVVLEVIMRLIFLVVDFWTSEEEIWELEKAKRAAEEKYDNSKINIPKPKIVRVKI